MKLLIMSSWDAEAYLPREKTYALRIKSARGIPYRELVQSKWWVHTVEYTFDDIWPGIRTTGEEVMFDEGLARRVLQEFNAYKAKSKSLLVHCGRGINRSPAVAIALNELFRLGHDSEVLKREYPESNWYVYDTLMQVGKDLSLG